jgi:hypothetical protein
MAVHLIGRLILSFPVLQVRNVYPGSLSLSIPDPGLSLSSQNYGLESGIWDPEKTYSGSRIQGSKGTGSRIRIRNTGSGFRTEGSEKNLFRILDPGHRIPDPDPPHWSFLRTEGSGKNLFRILDPGHRIPDPDPQHCSFLRTDGCDAVGPAETVRAARHEAADLRHVQVHLHPLASRHVLPAGPRDLALLYTGTALFTMFCLASSTR